MIKVIILQGPSGSGKTTFQQKLGFPKIVTWTTREPRKKEINGVDYHFVDDKTFKKMQNEGQFLEVTEYKSNYYGTTIESIKNITEGTKSIVLDASGAKKMKALLGDQCLCIGVYSTKQDCEARLRKRFGNDEDVIKRIMDYEIEVNSLFECDLIINNSNDNLEKIDWYAKMIKEKVSELT